MLTLPDDMGLAVRCQQPVDQRLQAIGLVDDDLRVFDQGARLDVHLEQLRRAANAAERILDLVREIADQLLGRLRLLEGALLALLARLLLDLDDLEDDVARGVDLVDDDAHRQASRRGWHRGA